MATSQDVSFALVLGALIVRIVARHPYALIYVVALLARVIAIVVLDGPRLSPDSHSYLAAAQALREDPFSGSERLLQHPPLFPLLLALTPSTGVAAAVQIALASAAAPLLGRATERHFGRGAGTITAVLVAVEPNAVFWSAYLLTDSIALSLFALALERASAALGTMSLWPALAAGVALGASYLTRAAYGLAAVLLALSLGIARRSPAVAVAVVLGVVLVLAAPLARNVVSVGRPLVYDARPWALLWVGTQWNEIGRATSGVDVVVPPEVALADPEAQSAFFREDFQRTVTTRPGEFARLLARKALWYVLPAYPEWSPAHRLLIGGYLTAAYVLAIAGLVAGRASPFAWLVVGSLAAFVATSTITIVDYDARYRLPFEVLLLPLTAAALTAAGRRLMERRP